VHRAVLELELGNEAETLLAALLPDNDGMLKMRRDGEHLILEASASTPRGLLRTLDDALACLRAAGVP
jgi:hypothetical protein